MTEKGIEFFMAYLEGVKLEEIPRSGFSKWGIYQRNQKRIFRKKAQSDSEHCNGMHTIASNLPLFYPEVFSLQDSWKYHLAITNHEYGENFLKEDIADEGSRAHAEKAAKEHRYVFEFIEKIYPEEHIEQTKQIHSEFEQHDTYFGMTVYVIDKIDAILRGFTYELNGRGGKLSKKRHRRTEKDKAEAIITGVDDLPDNWLCGLLPNIKGYLNLPVFIEIVQSAAFYVRSKPMEWLNPAEWLK